MQKNHECHRSFIKPLGGLFLLDTFNKGLNRDGGLI